MSNARQTLHMDDTFSSMINILMKNVKGVLSGSCIAYRPAGTTAAGLMVVTWLGLLCRVPREQVHQ